MNQTQKFPVSRYSDRESYPTCVFSSCSVLQNYCFNESALDKGKRERKRRKERGKKKTGREMETENDCLCSS